MSEYEFILKFRLPDTSEDPGRYVDALGEQGCDDALIGIGKNGRIALEFCRAASSAEEAVFSAIRNVRDVVPGAALIEASPDLVGLSDIAGFLGFSRQNMRKIVQSHAGHFPDPVHEGSPSIWHLARVLLWMRRERRIEVSDELLDVARVNMQFNIARELPAMEERFRSRVEGLL